MTSRESTGELQNPASEGRVFSSLIEHAVEVSSQWHDRTYRKSRWRSPAFEVPPKESLGVPVMAHVTIVAMTLQRAGWDADTVAAAFLHDVLEDGNYWGDHMSLQSLVTLFGEVVAGLVVSVTEQKFDPSGNAISWRERKESYVDVLRSAPAGAIAISLADKLHNLWSINESLQSGLNVFEDGVERRGLGAGPEMQEWFFLAVLDVSATSSDERLEPLRAQLQAELSRFRKLVANF